MLPLIANLVLGASQVLPVLDMLHDVSEAAEAEAKAAANALFGLGAFAGSGAACVAALACFIGLGHPAFAIASLAASAACAAGAYVCKRRLDVTRAKLEQFKIASIASKTAKTIANKTADYAVAAAQAALSGGKAAAAEVAALPQAASDAAVPLGRAAQSGASTAMNAASAVGNALADPKTRQAAAELAEEAFHGLARGAGLAAGWIKSRRPADPPVPQITEKKE